MSVAGIITRQLGAAVFSVAMLVLSASSARASPYAAGLPVTANFSLGPTSPGKWGSTVTWSLMPTGASCAGEAVGCVITSLSEVMPSGFLGAIQSAFNAWSAVANIQFIQVADDGAAFNTPTTSGDIRLGAHAFDGPDGALAHGFYPPDNGISAAGDIHFDVAELWKIGFGGAGYDLFQVTAHEIGHAIGLDHTLAPGALMGPFYTEAFSGPQADDIAGARFLYGAPVTVDVAEPGALGLVGVGFAMAVVLWRRRSPWATPARFTDQHLCASHGLGLSVPDGFCHCACHIPNGMVLGEQMDRLSSHYSALL